MTTIAFEGVMGPQTRGSMVPYPGSFDNTYSLDDVNDSVAWKFVIPSDGIITDVGFYTSYRIGNPPNYRSGIMPIQPASGFPVVYGTHYGGSSAETITPTVGWNWVTLTTPATASAGDLAAVMVYPPPSGTMPNGSNRIDVCINSLYSYSYNYIPEILNFSTAWTLADSGFGTFAVRYNDGRIYGFPLSEFIETTLVKNASPDEVGCRFTLPCDVSCVGPSVPMYETNLPNCGIKITLYDGSDAVLRSLTYNDSDEIFRNDYGNFVTGMREMRWDSPVSLTKDSVYRLTYQNLTTVSGLAITGIKFIDSDSKNSNFFNFIKDWWATSRTASGTWADDNTSVYDMGIFIESITVEATASGVTTTNLGGSYAYVS